MTQYKKELFIDLSWVNPKHSGGGHYASKNIIDCILKNKKLYEKFDTTIIARKNYFKENNFPNKINKIAITNLYFFNFFIRFFILFFLNNNKSYQIYFCPNIYTPILKRNFKIVNVIYDNQWKYYPEYFSLIKRLWINLNIFFIKKNTNKVICESYFIKKEFPLFKKKSEVIYIPFNIKQKIIKKSKNKNKFFFILSSMLPHKNIKMIEDLFLNDSIKTNVKNLIIAGIGGEKKVFKKNNKKIIYLGKISEKKKKILFRNCEAYLFPSKYEGFGMTIVEALIQKKKIICSNLSVFKESGGKFPYFIKNKSSKKNWALGISRINRKKISHKKINTFLKRFDSHNISNQYLSLFEKL
jgi:hypothetical protein|tara:strand:+ start:1458 stop:2522 length:1065 start_codon:yes stop_codon:yes gene_type:complete